MPDRAPADVAPELCAIEVDAVSHRISQLRHCIHAARSSWRCFRSKHSPHHVLAGRFTEGSAAGTILAVHFLLHFNRLRKHRAAIREQSGWSAEQVLDEAFGLWTGSGFVGTQELNDVLVT